MIDGVLGDSIGAHGIAHHVQLLEAEGIYEVREMLSEDRIAQFVHRLVREAKTDAVESEDLKMLRQRRNVSPPAVFPARAGAASVDEDERHTLTGYDETCLDSTCIDEK